MYSGLMPPSTQLMTGNFISRKIHPNQEQILKTYNEVWGNVGGGLEKVEGVKVSIEELEDNSGLMSVWELIFGNFAFNMKYNQETSNSGRDGSAIMTYTWRTGPNSIRVRNSNENVTEMVDTVFHHNGLSSSATVSNKVTSTSAYQAEFYERVDENGAAKTLYLGYY